MIWIQHSSRPALAQLLSPNKIAQRLIPAESDMWKREGIMKHAQEYWLLARIMLERKASSQQEREVGDGRSNFNSELHDDVLPEQEKYDETSMSQLNALLTSFQALKMKI
jgi:hypothetical protein